MPDCDKCKRASCPGWTRCSLVDIQPTMELERKAKKARRRQNIWTVEEIDAARRFGDELAEFFKE